MPAIKRSGDAGGCIPRSQCCQFVVRVVAAKVVNPSPICRGICRRAIETVARQHRCQSSRSPHLSRRSSMHPEHLAFHLRQIPHPRASFLRFGSSQPLVELCTRKRQRRKKGVRPFKRVQTRNFCITRPVTSNPHHANHHIHVIVKSGTRSSIENGPFQSKATLP